MKSLYEFLIFTIIIIVIIISTSFANYKNIINKIKSSWGKYKNYEFSNPDSEEYLKYSFNVLKQYSNNKNYIDDLTWNDLEMIKVFNKINTTYSSVGADILYYRLRNLNPSLEEKKYLKISKIIIQNMKKIEYPLNIIFINLENSKIINYWIL